MSEDFVGLAEFGTFKNSASFGAVTSTVTEWESRAGGFIGCAGNTEIYANSNVTFVSCHSASLVTCDEKTTGGFAGKLVAGTTNGCSLRQPEKHQLAWYRHKRNQAAGESMHRAEEPFLTSVKMYMEAITTLKNSRWIKKLHVPKKAASHTTVSVAMQKARAL